MVMDMKDEINFRIPILLNVWCKTLSVTTSNQDRVIKFENELVDVVKVDLIQ